MKKNIFNVLVVLLALCCLFVGCDNPANNGEKNEWEPTGPAVANWFEYTTSTPTGDGYYTKQTSIFYINTDGKIERAGSESYEYFGTELEMIQNTLSWSICYENSNNITLNIEFKVTEPPVWAVEKISAGWYAYTTNSNNQQITIFYINADGEIERAGNQTNEYSGTQLETLQNQFSYSICTEKANNSTYIEFNLTEPPVWADNTSADNPNNDDSDGETDIPSEDEEPEITLPTGYEWWCFKGAYVDGMDCFVLYDNNGTPVKTGSNDSEDKTCLYLLIKKSQAINNFIGIRYKITDLTQLPSWALQ